MDPANAHHLGSTPRADELGENSVYTLMGPSGGHPPRRRAVSLESMKRVLGVNSLSSRLSSARATLPHYRFSLPSMAPLKSLVPRTATYPSFGATPAPSSQCFENLERRFRRASRAVSKVPKATSSRTAPNAPDNQTASSREAALAAALAWIESLDQAECAYASQYSLDLFDGGSD
jgi:hypothetical protein